MIKGIKQASKAAACPDGDDVHSQSCGAAAADAAERGGAALSISSKRGRSSSDSGGGIHITIKDLTYSVPSRAGKRGSTTQLLSGVTAYFQPGCMSALLGPSGSGKTTCLDLIAGRKNTGRVQGDILFAGSKPTLAFLRKRTGYVEQFDTLLGTLTVEEMLLYTCQLTRPFSETLESKKAAVEDLLQKLALTSCRSVRIGDPLHKGISGGEAKRTNIGIQLITNPRALLLDEPTSGLDSFTANEVMGVIKSLVSDGVTIIATIHSPTSYAFSLFDSLMILLRGRVAYFGGSGSCAVDYINRMTLVTGRPSHTGLSDAELLIDVFTRADRLGEAGEFAHAYSTSKLHSEALSMVELLSRPPSRRVVAGVGGPMLGADGASSSSLNLLALARDISSRQWQSVTVTPWWWGLAMLFKYRALNNYRTKDYLLARLPDKIIQALVLSSLYFGVGANFSLFNLINVAAILFMWTAIPAFGAAAFCPAIVLDRPLFVRERHDGLYRVATYLLAKIVEEVVVVVPVSLIAAVIIFHAVQFQGNFVIFWLVYLSTLCCGIAMAYFVAATSPTMEVANAILPVYVGILWFFSGFLIRLADIPPWWRWFGYINPLRYAFSAAIVNEFKARDPVFVGGTLLQFYHLDGQEVWPHVTCVWGFFMSYILGAWFFMSFVSHHRR